MEVGTYFKNTSTCNARTGFQTATGLGANNTGDAAFRGGMGGTGGMMKYDAYYLYLTFAMAGGGGGAASMVSNGPRGGNSVNPGTGGFTSLPQQGGDGLTASRTGGGGGAAGAYYYIPGGSTGNPEYIPDSNSVSGLAIYGCSSNRGGGVGVDYAGPTGTAGIGSKTAGAPMDGNIQTVTAPTRGGNGSSGAYGKGGGAGINPGTGQTNVYKGSDGAVNIKWGNSNTFPWL
jgi:hypothetical protein